MIFIDGNPGQLPAGSPFTQFRWGPRPGPMEAVVGFSDSSLTSNSGEHDHCTGTPMARENSQRFVFTAGSSENCFLYMSPCCSLFIEDGLVGGCPWYPKPGSAPAYGTFLGCGFNTEVDKRWTFGTPWLGERSTDWLPHSETEPLHSVRVLAS